MQATLEDYLRNHVSKNKIDFNVRATITEDNRVTFYIHPAHPGGITADFEVDGNKLAHNRDISYGEEKQHN